MGYRILLMAVCWLCAPAFAADTSEDLLGPVSVQTLLSQPAFQKNYDAYPVPAVSKEARAALRGVDLVVLFGSWCHDSVREVPRLLKTVAPVADIKLQLIGIDRQKQTPSAWVSQYQLAFTPTVIVLRDGRELGRVIERPEGDWLAQLTNLVNEPTAKADAH